MNDGRTVIIRQLNFKASEDEVRKAFAPYGTILLARMPRHETQKGRNKGIAFITFSSTDEAQAALAMDSHKIKDREIRVEIAQENQKRSTRHASSTPADAKGGKAHRSASPSTTIVASEPRSERTVFLTQVPDTVNEARLRNTAAKYGEVVKCILKTNHQGALIEFSTIKQAGEASLGLDGYEIAPDRKFKVVSEEEMHAQKAEKKIEGFAARPKAKTSAAPPLASGIVKRPTQPGNRARKGGNLGQRSALLRSAEVSHKPEKEPEPQTNGASEEEAGAAKKSNADFRALVIGGNKSDA